MSRTENGWVELVRDAGTGIESIRAHFDGHAYDPHFHDAYLIGVTEQGVQQFHCRRALHRCTPGHVILIEPGEVHDGHAPEVAGFTYRMLYLDTAWLQDYCERKSAASDRAVRLGFRSTLMEDPRLARVILRACRSFHGRDPRLVRDTALDDLVDVLTGQPDGPVGGIGAASSRTVPVAMRRLRDLLQARMSEEIGLDRLAQEVGTDRFRLTRQFRTAYGVAPHAYLVQLRLNAARSYLAAGMAPAETAAAVGFADQSHLGRWFRRAYRLTPAAYRQLCTNVPDSQRRVT